MEGRICLDEVGAEGRFITEVYNGHAVGRDYGMRKITATYEYPCPLMMVETTEKL